jgi:hypothetical protein
MINKKKEENNFANNTDVITFEFVKSLSFIKYMYTQGAQYYSVQPYPISCNKS